MSEVMKTMKIKSWTILLMMLAEWVIRAAWRTVEILQEVCLMDRMSISALLGAVIFDFTLPKKEIFSVFELELEMLRTHQNAHQRGSISLLPALYLPTLLDFLPLQTLIV